MSAAAAQPSAAEMLADSAVVPPGETLMDFARTFDLGFVEIMAANPGIDPWLPPDDTTILKPTAHLLPLGLERTPLVINLAELRLYWRRPDGSTATFPVGIGRDGMGLGPTITRVVRKRREPVWVPPPSVLAEKPWLPPQVPPGPDNPLGAFSLDLADGLIRIHGTNLPDGVGRRVSHGCFRLYPEDIERLFPQVAVGTPVAIVDERLKLSMIEGELWLELHPGQDNADAIEAGLKPHSPPPPDMETRIAAAAGESAWRVDWQLVGWTRDHPNGIPIRITRPTTSPPQALLPQASPPPPSDAP